ncbi:hypothetical protein Tco_1404224 [Tanacetum coccineum]
MIKVTMASLLEGPNENKQFFGHDKEDPHAHIRYFNKITSTMKFQQRFDETFYEAWDRFNDLLRACPHHGFSELHQLDTFYNALNSNDQDSLNSAAGGNFLDKMPRDCLRIIESKSKVRNSRNKPLLPKLINFQPPTLSKRIEQVVLPARAAANFNQGNTGYRGQISNQIRPPGFPPVQNHHVQNQGNNQNRYNQNVGNFNQLQLTNRSSKVKSNQLRVFQTSCVSSSSYPTPALKIKWVVSKEDSMFVASNTASTSGTLPSNTVTNPKEDLKGITTRSGVAYKGLAIPITSSSPKVMERDTEVTKDTMHPTNNGSTEDVPPPVVPLVNHESISKPSNTLLYGMLDDSCQNMPRLLNPLNRKARKNEVVYVTGGKVQFPADLVVVDFEPDHPSSNNSRVEVLKDKFSCIIDTLFVYEGEITLRVGKEAITFNLDQTSRYTADYNHMTANRIDVIDMACEEYSQEVLCFSDVIASGNPIINTIYSLVSTSSPP